MSKLPIPMMRRGNALVPATPWAEEMLDAIPEGKDLNVRIAKVSRITGNEERTGLLNLWWAGLGLLAENTEDMDYDTARKASDSILRALGFTRPRHRIDHTIEPIPVSISEDNMADDEFILLFERARAFIVARFGFDPWDTWKDEKEAEKAMRRSRR